MHQQSSHYHVAEFRARGGPAQPGDQHDRYQAQNAESESEREKCEGRGMQQPDPGGKEARAPEAD